MMLVMKLDKINWKIKKLRPITKMDILTVNKASKEAVRREKEVMKHMNRECNKPSCIIARKLAKIKRSL